MKAKELRALTAEELLAKREAFKRELLNMRVRRKTAPQEKKSSFLPLKRDIARINTLLTEKGEQK